MKKSGIIGGVVAVLLVGGAASIFAIAWRPAIAAIDPVAKQSFDPAQVKRGRELAALGNCNSCHTVRGGKNFAGGLPVPTPFGTVVSSNITPDPETGIGLVNDPDIKMAITEGLSVAGGHLSPPMPYSFYKNMTPEDVDAVVAYIRTIPPIKNKVERTDFQKKAFPARPGAQ